MKNSKFINYIFGIIIILLVLYVLYYFINNFTSKTTYNNMSFYKNKTFRTTCKYADVEFTTSSDGQTLYITVNYKDLTGVSAIHIHTNNNGMPGPILAWLGTTTEWQHGVAQNTPGSNSPCCSPDNPLCVLAAPENTPNCKNLSNTVQRYTVQNRNCKDCPWLENGTLLDVHGFNFQKVINGKPTNEKPGADMIINVPFTLVNN